MTPFFFGGRSRQLFGVYRGPAAASGGAARAVVLCNPWAHEALHAHRSVRQAAAMLADAGLHALQFDYLGTGDSAREMQQVSIADWEEDIRLAVREVTEISNAHRVTLVGLRFGALLAARVAPSLSQVVDRLILWDPVLDGDAYLRELFQTCHELASYERHPSTRRPVPRPAEEGGGFELLGYPMTDRMMQETAALKLADVAGDLPLETFVMLSGEAKDEAALRTALVPPLRAAAIERIPGIPCWVDYWPRNLQAIPAALLDRLVIAAK
jgi:exosortase A-associated hydrolase 2